jgi:MFS transporter, ACS family, glucarate transporter
VRWRVLWLMVIGSMVAYVLRLNVSIAGEAMIRDLLLSPVQFGLILSAFAWGYGIFQVSGGLFGEWLGPRRALTVAITAWGLVTLGTALLPPAAAGASLIIGVAIVLRFLTGAAQAPLFPVTAGCSVRAWFPMSGWAMPNAWMAVGATVGGVIAGPFVAWLVIQVGWRGSFLVVSPLAFIGAAVWWWYTRDDPATHPHVNEAELALIRADPPPPALDEPGAWKAVLVQRDVLLLTASYFCTNYVFYLFFNWFFFYLTEVRQFSAQVSVVAALTGGMICERLIRRWGVLAGTRATAVGGLTCCAGLLVAGAAAGHVVLAVVLLCLSFGCVLLVDTAYWVAAMAAGGRHAATATGLMNTGGNVVGALGAVSVPLIAGVFGWFAAVASGALFALVAAGIWFAIRLPAPQRAEAVVAVEA